MVKRSRFTPEFKREAVRLLEGGDKPASEVAVELGIWRNQLYKWQAALAQSGDGAFRGSQGSHRGQAFTL